MNLSVIDCIFALIIFVITAIAVFRGFVTELFNKAAWILGIGLSIFYYYKLAALFQDSIKNTALRNVISFLLIFSVVFLLVNIFGTLLNRIFEVKILQSLDKALGLFFGLLEGLIIVTFIIFILEAQPFFNTSGLFYNSWFYSIVKEYVNPAIREVTKNV